LIQVRNDGGNNHLELLRSSNDANCAAFWLTKSRGSAGSPSEISNGDSLGIISFKGYDGVSYVDGAYIIAQADGSWTDGGDTTDAPTRLVFSTVADGTTVPTERMRINAAGQILASQDGTAAAPVISRSSDTDTGIYFGTNTLNFSAGGASKAYVSADGIVCANTSAGANAPLNSAAPANTGEKLITFYRSDNYSIIGTVTNNGGNGVAYNTTSDYRLKENIEPLVSAVSRLNQIPVYRFNYKGSPDYTVDGFIAHEVQAIVPEAITGIKDEIDANGNPLYQGIDQSKLVPLLTAALQEAIAKIASLEARLTALEAN
jgi:hypothetical protein